MRSLTAATTLATSLVVALVAVQSVAAQAAPAAVAAAPGARLSAVAVRAEAPPLIDGREDDAVWRVAPPNDQFLEFSPTEGKAARFRTEFRAAYDDRNLYVFVRAFDPHPDSIMTALTRRDVRGASDQLKLMIDAYDDRRSGFEFAVNPVGVKRDYAMYNDREEDQSWDGVWDAGTRVDSAGWTAEFRIPLSQLRYANRADHVFGFGVWRDIERYKERTSWPLYRNSQSGISSQLGELRGIRDIAPFRRRELVPYVVAKNVSVARSLEAGGPDWGRSQKASVGADLKYGITPNLTVDATVNPDFGQVEADPSQVNLTAFETFFQERRPFFVEGTGLYEYGLNCSIVNCGGEGLFYSRRIGRSPQLLGRYGDDASVNVTPILGAAKLTGRLPNGLNVGALEAVTDRVTGVDRRTTEPRASYTVLRAQQELRQGATSIGAIATGTVRDLDDWTDPFLRRQAFTGGLDLRHRWGKSRYEATASVTGSQVRGSAESILLTQTSPVHLYQRPDDALALDTTRTSLTGDGEDVTFGKFGGNMIHWQTSYERQSPGFETNDVGYLRRANQQSFNNWMGLQWRKPTRFYRSLQGNFNAWGYWTAAGLQTDRLVNTNWHANLPNNMWLNAGATVLQLPGSFCDNCARGGPAYRRSPAFSWNTSVQGDDRRSVVPALFFADAYGEGGRSRNIDVSPSVELRPRPELQVELSAEWNRNDDDVQWLGNFTDDAGATHYSFARLEQRTTSLGVRLSYTATPTLGIQLYGQPFVSRGRFSDVRELSADPRARRYEDRFAPYAPPSDTPLGFDVMQLRSNSVLRWEFRPGSTLFAVWSHGRDGYDASFQDRPWRSEYRDLFGLHPANTFLVKLAYWLD